MIKIGEFTISRMEGGTIVIKRDNGEGLELTEDEFSEHIDRIFLELF